MKNRISTALQDLRQDIPYSLRGLFKRPTLAILTTLSTAVGIGACSLIFAIANFTLFRTLPVPSAQTLLSITGGDAKTGQSGTAISYPDFVDLSKAPSLASAAAYFPMMPGALSVPGGQPRRYWGTIASANYFAVVRPALTLGRGFNPATDNTPGAPPVVVISHRLWVSFLGADPSILGRSIQLNHRALTVIGVAPPDFLGTDVGLASDFWIPFSLRDLVTPFLPQSKLEPFADRDAQWLFALARLRPQATPQQALVELQTLAQTLAATYPATNKDRTVHSEVAGQLSPALRTPILVFFLVLMIAAALVLLTSCANVANLLLARGYTRHREMATRMALGARRSRLVRQLLTESILLALPGGALGCLVAFAGAHSMRTLHLPIELPVDLSVSLDWRVLLFCALLSLLTGIVFGLAPALKLIRQDLMASLGTQTSDQLRNHWWSARNLLAVTQIAICVVLLTCAGLFFHSLQTSQSAQTGMSHRNLGLISFDATLLTDPTNSHSPSSLLQAVQQVPGIESAALTTSVPLSLAGVSGTATSRDNSHSTTADIYQVSPSFFSTLGIPILSGQDFPSTPTDDTVILNTTAAQQLFPNQNPINRQIVTADKQTLRVVAVVATTKSRSISEQPRACLYRSLSAGDLHSILGATLIFRTAAPPAPYLRRVSNALHSTDPGLALFDIKTMDEHLSNALLFPRTLAFLFGATGITGLLIATFGIYGVISFLVARQTREIGIRMALGASRRQILLQVLKRGAILTLTGALSGLAIAFLIGKAVASLLYGVTPSDPLTFISVPLVLFTLALAACAIPALRAATLEPLESIRTP